jgi:AbrB family looped-hinge helix DNA binding protein
MGPIGSITSKGQTTVPKEVRERLGLGTGTRLEWVVQGDHAIVKPRKLRAVDLAGILHRPGMKAISLEEMKEAVSRAAAEEDDRIIREWKQDDAGETDQ